MATAVLQPQSLALDREIMAPSPISQNSSRHGRSRHGGSVVKGNKARGRGYSIVDDREVMISKALTWVLKRTVEEGEGKDEGEEKLVCDAEGWVDCEKVLQRQNIEALQVTFPELQTLIASSTSKQRFALKLKQTSEVGSEVASDWVIRTNSSQNSSPSSPTPGSASKLTPLTTTSKDLPDLIVYETSYANYPLILASGGIKRAGGQAHLQFSCIKIKDDGTEARPFSDADVSIYINLRAVMESNPKVEWLRAENGNIMTEGDANGGLEKKHWKKAVGRRADIGVLFED